MLSSKAEALFLNSGMPSVNWHERNVIICLNLRILKGLHHLRIRQENNKGIALLVCVKSSFGILWHPFNPPSPTSELQDERATGPDTMSFFGHKA